MKRFICIFFCFVQLSVKAQQYRFINYSVSDGLSQNSVHCIYQDSDGVLWIGTQDGLNSFDGHNFKTYWHNHTDTNTISDQFILSMADDNIGYLWVGTGNGLNRINRRTGKVQRYYFDPTEQDRISSNYPLIIKNNSAEIFIGHRSRPMIVDKNGSLKELDKIFCSMSCAGFDTAGNFWGIRKATHEFVKAENITGKSKLSSVKGIPVEIFNDDKSYKLKIDNNNCIWFYPTKAKGSLYFYKINSNTWHKLNKEIPSAINDILITKNGIRWVAAQDGIYIIKEYVFAKKIAGVTTNSNTLPSGSILSLFEDNRQNIWIGSANSGFAYYNPSFENYRLFQTGLLSDAISTVVSVGNNKRWVGTVNGLLMLTQNDNQEFSIQKKFFTGKRITGLAKDGQNCLWVAVQNDGLYILNNQGAIIQSYKRDDSLLRTKRVLYLFCDSRNRIFVCTENGYFIFTSRNKWHVFDQKDQKHIGTGKYVLHAYEDKEKNIWLSKNLGVEVLDSNLNKINELQSATSSSPIDRTIITACTQDKNGNMWIGTLSNGIYVYNGKKISRFTTATGLSSNVIFGLLTDDIGRIWATTTLGINVYEPAEKKFYQIAVKDGLPSSEFLLGAFFKNEKGELLAGCSKGLITIAANNITPETKVIAARISDLIIDGKSIDELGNYFVVAPNYKTISFEFAVKEALQPMNIYYQYRLRGVDDKWTTLSMGTSGITFSRLPYGKLIMEIRAAYALPDIESAPVGIFNIDIKPPFTQTVGFRVIMSILIIAGIALALSFYYKRKNRKQLQALQKQKELQQERNRISRDLHDNIGAYTSALKAGLNHLKTTDENKEQQFAELNEYATNIVSYLRETIWVLSHEQLTLTAFSDRIKNYATRIVKNYPQLSVSFAIDILNERQLHPQVSLNLFRIVQEALQNACKHADATEVEIGINSETRMRIFISDNGIGITDEARQDSYGIRNMQARANESGFDIKILSDNGKGTEVILNEIS